MMSKEKKIIVKKVFFTLAIALFLFWTIFPIYWMVITSFKNRQELYQIPPTFFPMKATLENYVKAFIAGDFGTYIKNSIIATTTSSVFAVCIATMGGYPIARMKFKGKGLVMGILLATQMVCLMTAIIPIYNMMKVFGLIDSLWSLIFIYTVSNIPFCMLTITSFYKQIPISLEEAARIDGCSLFGAVVRITLPAMKPGLVSNFVFAFTGSWNEMFMSIMLINRDSNRTIPAGLMSFVSKFDVNWGQMCAGTCVTLIPVIVMFFLVQKHIVAGLTSGAVKE